MKYRVVVGDVTDTNVLLEASNGAQFDAVLSDPPYGISFLGRAWDHGVPSAEVWDNIMAQCKPGALLMAFGGSRTFHRLVCNVEDAGWEIRDVLMWLYGCHDEQTQCLTRRGWVDYEDIAETDEVCQWDSETSELSWVHPTAIIRKPYTGEMVRLVNRHTDQCITPNHRVYAKVRKHARNPNPQAFEVIEAADLRQSWIVDIPMAGRLIDGKPEPLAYLIGWWLTDAWAHGDGKACMFSQSKPATLEKLRAALMPLGASEYVKEAKKPQHADEHTFYLTGDVADELLDRFPERRLEWEVMSWDETSRRELYRGLMDGDGSQPDHQHAHTFWSQDQERRDVFVALCVSLGMRAYEGDGCVYVNTATSTTQLQSRHRKAAPPEHYEGDVWCLRVPKGAFVVRRNGRPFISGNSGFPKNHNIGKALDKMAGEVRASISKAARASTGRQHQGEGGYAFSEEYDITIPATPIAEAWEGHGSALKPAYEPVICARKNFRDVPPRDTISQIQTLIGGLVCLLKLSAKSVDGSFWSSLQGQGEGSVSAQAIASVLAGRESPERFGLTDMSNLPAPDSMCLSIATSWNSILGELLRRPSMCTTSTATEATIALRTLRSLILQTMHLFITKEGIRQLGLPLSVLSAEGCSSESEAKRSSATSAREVVMSITSGSTLNVEDAELYFGPIIAPVCSVLRSAITLPEGGLDVAYEPVVLAQAPRDGTFANNVSEHWCGGLWIDGGRIPTDESWPEQSRSGHDGVTWNLNNRASGSHDAGRWPANIILDEEAAQMLDEQTGERGGGYGVRGAGRSVYGNGLDAEVGQVVGYGDRGGASRFFYCAKASRKEREAGLEGFGATNVNDGRETSIDNAYQRGDTQRRNIHPTVKPIDLCRYLATLLLPPPHPDGKPRRILVPFSGSGSEMIGCLLAGWDEVVGIEQSEEYADIARARLAHWHEVEFGTDEQEVTQNDSDGAEGAEQLDLLEDE